MEKRRRGDKGVKSDDDIYENVMIYSNLVSMYKRRRKKNQSQRFSVFGTMRNKASGDSRSERIRY